MVITKMHGLGNDFILINNTDLEINNKNAAAKALCDRHLGIGADGLILVEKSDNGSDIKMSIINSDGSTAEMCGNGLRCFCKFVYENKIVFTEKINVQTLAGNYACELSIDNNSVESVHINMGMPLFDKNLIPFNCEMDNKHYKINMYGKEFDACTMLMGVPHTILFTDDVDNDFVEHYGSIIEKNTIYPHGTNVNFVSVKSMSDIYVNTWERGAGRTLACGTGCCASAVASYINNKTNKKMNIHLAAGILKIVYDNGYVYMDGPAVKVFTSDIDLGKFIK